VSGHVHTRPHLHVCPEPYAAGRSRTGTNETTTETGRPSTSPMGARRPSVDARSCRQSADPSAIADVRRSARTAVPTRSGRLPECIGNHFPNLATTSAVHKDRVQTFCSNDGIRECVYRSWWVGDHSLLFFRWEAVAEPYAELLKKPRYVHGDILARTCHPPGRSRTARTRTETGVSRGAAWQSVLGDGLEVQA
jgi:hypothetical protein